VVAATLGADATGAQGVSAILSPQAQQEMVQVAAEIDRIEAQTMERLAARRTIRSSKASCSASCSCTTSSSP
jgi:hypothetical protein